MKGLSVSADDPRHLMHFRMYVSRNAAGKGKPVLEGVGLDAPTIAMCFNDNPLKEEAAVQAGLTKWVEGKGIQPPTWEVLLTAMEYAEIGKQPIDGLKAGLGCR